MDERTAPYWSGFLTKALYRGVSYLSKRDTLRLIREPVADTVRYAEDVPEQIWNLTAGQAFYTQVYCQALVDHLNERREHDVTSQDLEQVTNEIVENPLPQMIFSWNSMLPMEKIALSLIGEISKQDIKPVAAKDMIAFANKEKIGYDIDPSKLNEVLEKLFHHDLLDKDSSGSAYTFKMDLWRRWIGRMHSIWEVVDDLGSGDAELGEGLVKSRPRRARLAALVPAAVVLVAAFALIFRSMEGNNRAALAVRVDSTHVTIQTDPPGAWVYLNERRVGLSPMNALAAAGPTFLRIERDGYKVVTDTLDLKKDEPLDTSFTLTQRIGNVVVNSSPSGADIYLDGQKTGLQTPDTLKALPPSSIFTASDCDWPEYSDREWVNVRVQEDSTIALTHSFSKLKAQVRFDTEPNGAEIVVDGAVEGKTPAVTFLDYGSHDIVLRLSGYEAVQNTITIASANQTIHETFTKLPQGTLILKILPYADVYVGGVLQARQQSRYEAMLDPSQYEIELRHPAFENYTMRVEIVSNETTERTINMGTVKSSQ